MEQAIACDLMGMDKTQRARHRVVSQHVASAALGSEPVPDGFAIRYPADTETVVKLAEFITLERLCCPFFDFGILLDAGADQVELRITGGPGVQEFLQAEIESWR